MLPKFWLHWVQSQPVSLMTNFWSDLPLAFANLRHRVPGLFTACLADHCSVSLSGHTAALSAWVVGDARTTRADGTRLSPATGSEGTLEITFPAHCLVAKDPHNLCDGAVVTGLPPAVLSKLVTLLQPALRQLLTVLNPELQLWSVTVISMATGAARGAHIDPGRYLLVVTLTLQGEGSIRFTPAARCPHEAVSARVDAGRLVAFCSDARDYMKHAVNCDSDRLALVFRYGPQLY